jgi:hypothetical protein
MELLLKQARFKTNYGETQLTRGLMQTRLGGAAADLVMQHDILAPRREQQYLQRLAHEAQLSQRAQRQTTLARTFTPERMSLINKALRNINADWPQKRQIPVTKTRKRQYFVDDRHAKMQKHMSWHGIYIDQNMREMMAIHIPPPVDASGIAALDRARVRARKYNWKWLEDSSGTSYMQRNERAYF